MKKRVMQFLILFIAFVLLLAAIELLRFGSLTGFVIFTSGNQTDFDEGTYLKTVYNGSAVVLIDGNLSGNYTSKVFDAGEDAIWNNLSFVSGAGGIDLFFTVDNTADVWKSGDRGVTWTLTVDDYNGAESNGATAMKSNSSNDLFILNGQDLWYSSDLGVSWSKINDDFNPSDSNNGIVFGIDSDDVIYIIDGSQETWRSTDSGVTFSSINSDFNGGNGNAKGMAINSTNGAFLVDAQAGVWFSTDSGVSWTLAKDDYNGGNGNDANDMAVNSSDGLFILHGQDVWFSTDSGVTWTLGSDDFNGAGDSNNGLYMSVDSDGAVYVIDASEDVYKSSDGGQTFSLISSDFNGGSGNIFGFDSFVEYGNLTFQARNCSSSDCSDGVFRGPDGTANSYYGLGSDLSFNGGRYFQYKFFFDSPDSSFTPYLQQVQTDYTLSDNGAPSISLSSPADGRFLNLGSVELDYVATDSVDLDSCMLWGNFTGTYKLNQTDSSVVSGATSSFNLVLGEGNYSWSVECNDTKANSAIASNRTFVIDTTLPSLSLTEPSGSKTSRTNIPLTFIANDSYLDSCLYNVYRGATQEIWNTSISCSSGSGSFSVTVDADFVLNFFVKGRAGKLKTGNSSFSVSTSSGGGGGVDYGGESSGGASSGGGSIIRTPVGRELRVDVVGLEGLLYKRGSSETINVDVRSREDNFLNNCKLRGEGVFSSWINSGKTNGFSSGEKFSYDFVINVPSDAELGPNFGSVAFECDEGKVSHNFGITVYRNSFEIENVSYEKVDNQLRVVYSISENSNEEHELILRYEFIDFDEVVRKSGEEVVVLGAGFNGEQVLSFELPKDSFGEFDLRLVLEGSSGRFETIEKIFLPSRTGGLAGFVISEETRMRVSIIGIIVVSLILLVFIGRTMFKNYRKVKSFVSGNSEGRAFRRLIKLDLKS